MYDTIIVGAGIAGLTAAIYLRRANKKVLVLESQSCGGQIVNALDIENYPGLRHISGFDFISKVYKQVQELNVDFSYEKVSEIKNGRIKKVITEKNKYQAKTIILATGSQKRKLSLPNEDNLIGKGISYCATCDGNFYKGKTVMVVGGGNTAIEDAIYLSDIAKQVYLVHRRDSLKGAEKAVIELKKKKNVTILYESFITKILGEEKLEQIEISQNNNIKTMDIDGLFVAIGQTPESSCFKDLIKLDKDGYILAKENCHTNIKGIYAAGDIRSKKVRQLVTAASDGVVAACEAIDYLNMQKKRKVL